ncbi:MAG: hypothetical protein JNK87_37935 [Bryobacterales bacterium]|nr:hypothetical protein [Bryobacterales bacterium]
MARRKEPGQKEYNPLDDARGRLPIEEDLIRDVVAERPVAEPVPAVEPEPAAAASVVVPIAAAAPHMVTPMPSAASEPPREMGPVALPPAPAATAVPPPASVPQRMGKPAIALEKLTAQNKFLTTPREKLELDRLAAHLSGALGTSVKPSQIIRACLNLLLRAEYEIMRRAERQPPIKRPSNAEAVALAEFDQMLAEILSYAFRDSGPIKPRQ